MEKTLNNLFGLPTGVPDAAQRRGIDQPVINVAGLLLLIIAVLAQGFALNALLNTDALITGMLPTMGFLVGWLVILRHDERVPGWSLQKAFVSLYLVLGVLAALVWLVMQAFGGSFAPLYAVASALIGGLGARFMWQQWRRPDFRQPRREEVAAPVISPTLDQAEATAQLIAAGMSPDNAARHVQHARWQQAMDAMEQTTPEQQAILARFARREIDHNAALTELVASGLPEATVASWLQALVEMRE